MILSLYISIMIIFNEVTKIFNADLFGQKFKALDELSFEVEEGCITGYLGANGAGKTTSLKILMDFIRPTSGSVQYKDNVTFEKFKAMLGFLPERPFFYPHLTGREFCQYMGKLSQLTPSEISKQIDIWAPRFKIEFALDRRINTYSKGMLQRIGFLVTLLHNPELIVLDEPLSGLDPIGRKDLKDIILTVNGEGKSIFFSSHIVQDVQDICNKVIFIKDGKLVYQGSVDHIISENIKPGVNIGYRKDGLIHHKIVEMENRDSEIKKILDSDLELVSVNPTEPTLEEVFYNVK
jgi:ABC-2 type transport system ATP-binding protein